MNSMMEEQIELVAKFLRQWMFSRELWLAVFSSVLIVCLVIRHRTGLKALRNRFELGDQIVNLLQSSRGVEKNLNEVLSLVKSRVKAEGYAFYLLDAAKNEYSLRSVLHTEDGISQIGPSYGGLMPYKKESYLPPLTFQKPNVSEQTSVVKYGDVPVVVVPVNGGQGIINIGPLSRISKADKDILEFISEKLKPVLDILIEHDNLKKQVEVIVTSSKAMQNISGAISDFDVVLNSIVSVSVKTLGATGAFLLRKNDDSFDTPVVIGMEKNTRELLLSDKDVQLFFEELAASGDIISLKKDEQKFYRIPTYLVTLGIEFFYIVKINAENTDGIAVIWYTYMPSEDEFNKYRVTALEILSKKISEVFGSHMNFKVLTDSYVDMLKMMARMMDHQSPYSIGYSELMSRYATVICRQLNIGREETKEIALAAYLCNIGIIALTNSLVKKEGKYSELEYEVMKLHSDVGASIIEAILPNSRIASYIRHHHERMDGHGYPSGLKDAEIPIGARIIAVIQTFIAKISGRKDREPLSFDQALDTLRHSCGTMLDPDIVEAFIEWFDKKRQNPSRAKSSLGLCWEMRCSTVDVCASCPAYGKKDLTCWKVDKTNCAAHGNSCESCFVYTEYLNRTVKKSISQGA